MRIKETVCDWLLNWKDLYYLLVPTGSRQEVLLHFYTIQSVNHLKTARVYLFSQTFKGTCIIENIRICNPRKRNALNKEAYWALTRILNESNSDPAVNCVAITGTGDYYSSGNDIAAAFSTEEGIDETIKKNGDTIFNLVKAFYSFQKLLIAVVNGPAIGIAATTLALCDVVYCSEDAYFLTPFSDLGLCAEGCSSLTFPAILGQTKAAEMLMLNYKLEAKEALQFNFVSKIFTKNELDSNVWPEIERYSELCIGSIIATKSLMRKFNLEQLEAANRLEIDKIAERSYSGDPVEAAIKFLQRKSKM